VPTDGTLLIGQYRWNGCGGMHLAQIARPWEDQGHNSVLDGSLFEERLLQLVPCLGGTSDGDGCYGARHDKDLRHGLPDVRVLVFSIYARRAQTDGRRGSVGLCLVDAGTPHDPREPEHSLVGGSDRS
jgi:hypothetical protein